MIRLTRTRFWSKHTKRFRGPLVRSRPALSFAPLELYHAQCIQIDDEVECLTAVNIREAGFAEEDPLKMLRRPRGLGRGARGTVAQPVVHVHPRADRVQGCLSARAGLLRKVVFPVLAWRYVGYIRSFDCATKLIYMHYVLEVFTVPDVTLFWVVYHVSSCVIQVIEHNNKQAYGYSEWEQRRRNGCKSRNTKTANKSDNTSCEETAHTHASRLLSFLVLVGRVNAVLGRLVRDVRPWPSEGLVPPEPPVDHRDHLEGEVYNDGPVHVCWCWHGGVRASTSSAHVQLHEYSDTYKLTSGMMKKFHATANHRMVLLQRPRLYGPGVYSGLSSYRQRPSTGRMYDIWPERVLPEKNASNAVSEPIEIAPKPAESKKTTSDALFGVCVRLSILLSQSENGSALSRLYAKKMRDAVTNCVLR